METLEDEKRQDTVDVDMKPVQELVEEPDQGREKDTENKEEEKEAVKEGENDAKEAEKKGEDAEIVETEHVKEGSEGNAVEANSENEEADEGKKVMKKVRKKRTASDKANEESSKEPFTPNERPTRERKTVERYSAPQKSRSATKGLSIGQGKGTHLKDIPNVAYKLSKRKPDDNLQVLHSILFGKKTKIHTLKKNIGNFSGYVWIENEEKQKGKIKERLDKCVKEKLLDFCDVLNIPVSKTSTKKEELSIKLLQFLEAPEATTDTLLAEQEQRSKKRKARATKRSRDRPSKKKKETETGDKEEQVPEAEEDDEDEDDYVAVPLDSTHGSEDMEEDEKSHEQESDEGTKSEDKEEGEEEKPKKKVTSEKKSTKKSGSKGEKEDKSVKSPKISTSVAKKKRASDSEEASGTAASKLKVSASKSKKVEKEKEKPAKEKGKSSSKDQEKGKRKVGKKSRPEPSREDIHSVVVDTLKEVNFNTATLADIIKLLGKYFEVDLFHRKAEVKEIITEVINNMTDDEDDEDDQGESNSADEKDNNDDDDGENK